MPPYAFKPLPDRPYMEEGANCGAYIGIGWGENRPRKVREEASSGRRGNKKIAHPLLEKRNAKEDWELGGANQWGKHKKPSIKKRSS